MALTVTARGVSSRNTGSESTYVITPGSNFAAGSIAVLCVSYDNSGGGGADPYSAITDSVGNVWTSRVASLNDPGAGSAGAAMRIFTSPMNVSALTTGNTITVSFGGNTTVARAYALWEIVDSTGAKAKYKTGAQETAATATPTITSSSITSGNVIIGAIGREANGTRTDDSDTSNGNWSTGQASGVGTTTGGMEILSQYKVATGTATQTYNPTFGGASADGCEAWVEIEPGDYSSLPSKAIAVDKYAPNARTFSNSPSAIPSKGITVAANAPTARVRGVIAFSGFETGDSSEEASGFFSPGMSFVTSPVVGSGYALRLNFSTPGDVNNFDIRALLGTGKPTTTGPAETIYARFDFQYHVKPTSFEDQIFAAQTSGDDLLITLTPSGTLNVCLQDFTSLGAGSTVLSVDTWYQIELKVGVGTSAPWELRIDGATELSGTRTLGANHSSWQLGKANDLFSEVYDVYYDNFVVMTGDWPSSLAIRGLQPAGNGALADWTAGTGSANYLEVDEVTRDNDTTYIETTLTTGETKQKTVTLPSGTLIPEPILAVKAGAIIRRVSGATTIGALVGLRSGGTTSSTSAGTASGTSFTSWHRLEQTNPGTKTEWTTALVEAAEAYIAANSAASSSVLRCTQIYAQVLYVPAATGDTASIPSKAIAVDKFAPSAATTERHKSLPPVKAVAVSSLAPNAVTTEKHFSALPVKAIAVASLAPNARTSDVNNAALPVKAVGVAALAPAASTTERNYSAVPSMAVAVAALAPSAASTERHYSALPAKAVAVASLAPSALTTERHFSALATKPIAVAAYAPNAVTGEQHRSVIPVKAIALDALAVSAAATEHQWTTLPTKAIAVAGQTPNASTTERHKSALPLTTISVASLAPNATTGDQNYSVIPAKAVALAANAMAAATTEHNYSALPAKAVSIASVAVSAASTERHISVVPVASIAVGALAPTTRTTERHFAALASKSIAVGSYAVAAATTEANANVSQIPSAAAAVQRHAPAATTTERHASAIPRAQIAVASLAVSARTTELHKSAIPKASIAVASLAVSAQETERRYSAIPSASIGLSAYAIAARTTEANRVSIPVAEVISLAAFGITANTSDPDRPVIVFGANGLPAFEAGAIPAFRADEGPDVEAGRLPTFRAKPRSYIVR